MKSKNQVGKCYYCGKTGHLIKDCLKKISDMKQINNFSGSCKNDFHILVTRTRRDPKEWVLDFDCTFYMSPIREWFHEFIDINGGHVQMENAMNCQIKGIEKLRLMLNNNHILELNNTNYVLEFKRNLISLVELDDNYNKLIHKGLIKLNNDDQGVIYLSR